MTTERVRTDDLSEIDGFAVRAGPHIEVAISSAVPFLQRQRLAEELSAAVRSAPGCYVTVVRHIRDEGAREQQARPRWRAKGLMTVAAALMLSVDLAG